MGLVKIDSKSKICKLSRVSVTYRVGKKIFKKNFISPSRTTTLYVTYVEALRDYAERTGTQVDIPAYKEFSESTANFRLVKVERW